MIRDLLARVRFALQPAVFEIVLERATPRCVRGRVKRGFLEDCAEIARDHRLERGRIRGVRRNDGIRLVFSPDIPAAVHQRLRNAWQFHA